MSAAAGPFMIAAALLAIGGALKVRAPGDTAKALQGVGVPGSPSLVRVGALAELTIGCFALASGGRTAAVLVAGSYAAFMVFVTLALVRDAPIATCGCFGRVDTPPSIVHLAIDLGAVIAAVVVAVDPGVALLDVVDRQPLLGVPYLVLVATGVYVALLALTVLPRTRALVRASLEA